MIQTWEVHECDPNYKKVPKEAIHFEMISIKKQMSY